MCTPESAVPITTFADNVYTPVSTRIVSPAFREYAVSSARSDFTGSPGVVPEFRLSPTAVVYSSPTSEPSLTK